MGLKRPRLVNGEIYHIVLRAVEGLTLFCDRGDYFRMAHNLFEFNDENPASSDLRVKQYLTKQNLTRNDLVSLISRQKIKKPREMLVETWAFCLMPNHIHLLVKQLREGGISKFMRKIGTGYGLYYNRKYERKGHVFGGRYKIVLVGNSEQLKTVFVYIHTNPMAIIFPFWKKRGIKDLKKAVKFLEKEYQWSSYPDYLGKNNFPSLINREFLIKVMGGKDGCREFVNSWLSFKRELADFEKVSLE